MILQWQSVLIGAVLAGLVFWGAALLLSRRRIPLLTRFVLGLWKKDKNRFPPELTEIMQSPASVDEIAGHVLEYISRHLSVQCACVAIFDFESGYADIISIKLVPHFDAYETTRFPISNWLQHGPFRDGNIISLDLQQWTGDPQLRDVLWQGGVRILHFVPLLGRGAPIGSLNIGQAENKSLTAAEQMMLLDLSELLSLTIQQALFVEQARQQTEFSETLYEIGRALNKTLNQEELLGLILEELSKVVAYDSASILLLDEGGEILRNVAFKSIHTGARRTLRMFNVAEYQHLLEVLQTKQPVIIKDTSEDSRWRELETTRSVHSWLGVPLISDDGVIGLLNITKREVDFYHTRDGRVARIFAAYAVTVIGNARLYEAERRARVTAESLRAANMALTASMELETILGHILDYLGSIIEYDAASVLRIVSDGQIVVQATRSKLADLSSEVMKRQQYSLAQHQNFKQIFETKKGFIIPNTFAYSAWEHREQIPIRSWIGIPLLENEQVVGFLTVDKREPFFYSERDLQVAEQLAAQAAIAIQNANLLQETQRSVANLHALGQVLELLNSAPAAPAVLPKVFATLMSVTGCSAVFFVLLGKGNSHWGRLFAYGNVLVDVEQQLDLKTAVPEDRLQAGQIYVNGELASSPLPFERRLAQAGYRLHYFLPLDVHTELLGGISLLWQMPPATLPDKMLLMQMSNSIALAMERTQLFDAVHHRAQQLALLNRLGTQITGLLDTRALCQTVSQHLCVAFHYQAVSIYLASPQTGALALVERFDANGDVGLSPNPAMLETAVRVGHAQYLPAASGAPGIEPAQLALPLQSQGKTIGVMHIIQAEQQPFDEDERAILSIVADQLAVAIEKARLLQETQRQKFELENLYSLSTALRLSEDSSEIILTTLSHLLGIMQMDAVRIYLPPTPKAAQFSEQYQAPPAFAWRVPAQMEAEAIAVVRERGVWHTLTAAADQLPVGMETVLFLPVQTQRQTIGVIAVALSEREPLTNQERQQLTAVAEIMASALDRAVIHETLEEQVRLRTQELADANQKLLELDQLKSKFVADVSHELRTPITNLKLYLDIFERAAPAKQEKYLNVLRSQADRLAMLVEDILDFSNLATEQIKLQPGAVELNRVVQTAVDLIQGDIVEKGLGLRVDLAPDLPPVLGIGAHLRRLVTNLLHNGMEYTDAGHIAVQTKLADDSPHVYLRVEDTGSGILAEDMPHIFERFYRGHKVSQLSTPGTGLGLAIVKDILDMHKGTISVENNDAGGAVFEIWLPVFDSSQSAASIKPTASLPGGS